MRMKELLLQQYEWIKHNVEWNKSITKEFMLFDDIYVKFQNMHNQSMVLEVRTVVTLGKGEGDKRKGGTGASWMLEMLWFHIWLLSAPIG